MRTLCIEPHSIFKSGCRNSPQCSAEKPPGAEKTPHDASGAVIWNATCLDFVARWRNRPKTAILAIVGQGRSSQPV